MWVPFPFVETVRVRPRPALVINTQRLLAPGELIWVVMITSAQNKGGPDDIDLEDRYTECGLPSPSVVRPVKISTVEARTAVKLGDMPPDLMALVNARITSWLPIAP